MQATKYIVQFRKYLDYLEEHINNVKKSWIMVASKCDDLEFFKNPAKVSAALSLIDDHDLSKLSSAEFVPYQHKFYAVEGALPDAEEFTQAWNHHKAVNPHHHENWTSKEYGDSDEWELHCVTMIVDWMAMGRKFGDTARGYYEKNNGSIHIPDYAQDFMYKIFNCIEKPDEVKK